MIEVYLVGFIVALPLSFLILRENLGLGSALVFSPILALLWIIIVPATLVAWADDKFPPKGEDTW